MLSRVLSFPPCTRSHEGENESIRMLAPNSDSIGNSFLVGPSTFRQEKRSDLPAILTNRSVHLEEEVAEVNSDEEMILNQVLNATQGMSKKDRKAYLERELKAYETVDDSDEGAGDGMEVELEVDRGGDFYGDVEEDTVGSA